MWWQTWSGHPSSARISCRRTTGAGRPAPHYLVAAVRGTLDAHRKHSRALSACCEYTVPPCRPTPSMGCNKRTHVRTPTNRRLRGSGLLEPSLNDSVRTQLEALLAEKARLVAENSRCG